MQIKKDYKKSFYGESFLEILRKQNQEITNRHCRKYFSGRFLSK